MDNQAQAAGEQGFIAIDGEFTIYAVADWKRALFDKLDTCAGLDIDLSGVSEIDTAGQQLLVAAKHYASTAGKALRLLGHSQAVVDMLDLCRLGGFFGDPVLIAGHGSTK
jgi:anti-sigma B factor antagonist